MTNSTTQRTSSQTLREVNQWLIWGYDENASKRPMDVRGNYCGSTHADKYVSYDEAVAAANVHGAEGPAFCFTAEDSFCGIDLDKCLTEEGEVKEWAEPIVHRFESSYMEVSPSGTGIKIYVIGKKPDGMPCKVSVEDVMIEVYDCGRFFAFTGQQMYEATEATDCQDAIDWLAEEYFPAKPQPQATLPPATVNGSYSLYQRGRAYVEKCQTAGKGQRNSTAFSIAGHLFSLIGDYGGRLNLNQVKDLLRGWNMRLPEPLTQEEIDRVCESAAVNGTPRAAKGDRPLQRDAEKEEWIAEPPAPNPLPPELPEVTKFDYDLLPDAFRNFVTDVADRMQCPPDFPAVAIVVVFSSLIGRQISIKPKRQDDWTVIPNLWGLAVGRPGVMKSPAIDGAVKIARKAEVEERERFLKEKKQWQEYQEIEEERRKERRKQVRAAIKEGLSNDAIRDVLDEQELAPPSRRRYLVNDATVEKLGEILQDSPNGILLERDEIYSWLNTLDKSGHEADRGFYLTAWDGDKRYTYDRILRGETVIKAACVSIIGTIQPGRLQSYVRGAVEGGASDDGLLQRFQLAVWPDSDTAWKNVDRWPDNEAVQAVHDIAQQLVALTWDGARKGEFDEIPHLRFMPDAQDVFDDWRAKLEYRLRGDELSPFMESHLSKYRSLIPALSLIFHLVDSTGGDVSLDALNRATAWGEYLESHACRIYSAGNGRGALHELARKIKKGKLQSGFTSRDVRRKGWAGLSDASVIDDALADLESLAWLLPVEKRPPAGRPTVQYTVNPKLLGADQAQ